MGLFLHSFFFFIFIILQNFLKINFCLTLPKNLGTIEAVEVLEVITIIKLDYTLESPEERNELVKKILAETPDPNPAYLEILANYLVLCMEKQEKKERKILTDNRMTTVNKRETSFEGLVSQLENGEDGIYNLINESKTVIFQPKVKITKRDVEEIPFLKQLIQAINRWEAKLKTAQGKDRFLIKKTLIELRKDQYVIKDSYRQPIRFTKVTRSKHFLKLDDGYHFSADGYVVPEGFSLCSPTVCSAILCNYSKLKEHAFGNFEGDLYYLMEAFDDISEKALAAEPLYRQIVIDKIDGLQNQQIQEDLEYRFGTTHSLEYISSLWRKKIPKLIASAAEDELLDWHYLVVEKGKYKKCSRCGQIKLAHNKYFSKNKTSKDGFYSICKKCRNAKVKKV